MLDYVEDLQSFKNNTNQQPLPKFSQIEPRHLVPATQQLLTEYTERMAEFEAGLRLRQEEGLPPNYEHVMGELDDVRAPVVHIRRLTELLRSVGHHGAAIKSAAADVYSLLERHGMEQQGKSSTKIMGDTFSSLLAQEQVATNDGPESAQRVRALTGLLADLVDTEELDSRLVRLSELEARFSRDNADVPLPVRESIPFMYEILAIKKDVADFHDQPSYADYCLAQDRVVFDVASVRNLHDRVSAMALPVATKILAGEVVVENIVGDVMDGRFVLDQVLEGLFALTKTLFGVRVEPAADADLVETKWDRDVRLYRMYDEDNNNELLGSFYLDPFNRPYKQRGEWMGPLLDGGGRNSTRNNTNKTPVVYLSCYANMPTWDDSPTHLAFSDVKGLFHEFGHVLQYLLATDVEFASLSGVEAVEKDTIEFPSMFMEYWLYDEKVLASLLPEDYPVSEVLDRFVVQQQQLSAIKFTLQTFLGQLELDLHSTAFDPRGDESIFALQKRLAEIHIPHDLPHKGDVSKLQSVFQGNADGEAVNSYRYLWSDVMGADAFQAFAGCRGSHGDDDDDEELKKMGRRFRETILAPGGSVHAGDAFAAFRGRAPTMDALLSYHGLTEQTEEETETVVPQKG